MPNRIGERVRNKWEAWRGKARELKRETYAIYLAYHDRRVPWYAKIAAALVVGYAFSPIDLIPDFIPVLGYLDDLVLIPLGIAWVIRLIPADVLEQYREEARAALDSRKSRNWLAAGIIVLIWIFVLGLMLRGWGFFGNTR